MSLFKVDQGTEKECKELIEEGNSTVDSMTDIEEDVIEGLGSVKDGDAEPISSIIKRLRRRKVSAGNEEEDVCEGETMTLSEMKMLAKNQGRKKMKEKSKDNGSDKQKDRHQIEEDIGSQKQTGKMMEGAIKVYQRRTKLKENAGEKEKEDLVKVNGLKDIAEKGKESVENQHEEDAVQFKEEENTTLAKMQMLAKKKSNKGRIKLKHKNGRENTCNLEMVTDQREEEKEGEEVTLAEMRMSAKKKWNRESTKLKDKRGDNDDEQNDVEEQNGEEEKENDSEEVDAVKMRRKRGRYREPEVHSLVIESRTRDQRNRRKTLKLQSLEDLKRRETMAKEIEMEEEMSDDEEMAIMNLRKKRARRKPAELCSLEVINSASKTRNSDAEKNESNLEIVAVDDFDFYDFNKDRIGRKFQKGQVWAIYDDKDGMPRHYAVIDEVVSVNPFQVLLNWLDIQDTGDKASTSRENMSLPIACGSFKVSLSVTIKSRKIFSHIADFERAARELYNIYPRKGSVWAMFNKDALGAGGLNITVEKGSSYDIVVFLTSYSAVYGLSMAYLERVDGFKTVYKRKEIGVHAIQFVEGNDFRLFSHHIPARKLSGEEVSDLPKDCWELDPASIPESLAIGYEM